MKDKKFVIALEDMSAPPINTWIKGLDYEIVEKDNHFVLASNEAQISYANSVKDEVLVNFKRI